MLKVNIGNQFYNFDNTLEEFNQAILEMSVVTGCLYPFNDKEKANKIETSTADDVLANPSIARDQVNLSMINEVLEIEETAQLAGVKTQKKASVIDTTIEETPVIVEEEIKEETPKKKK
jgi:hypothetical protein